MLRALGLTNWKRQWGSVTHKMAVPVPNISCCILNHHNLFYQIQNALAFNRDTCCNLVLCLRLLPLHWVLILFFELKIVLFSSSCLYNVKMLCSISKHERLQELQAKMFRRKYCFCTRRVVPMFVEGKVHYSALFTNLVGCHASTVSFPLSDA